MPNFSPEQIAVINEMETGDESLVIDAVAGSGKTTTMVEGANRIKSRGIALAFNKRIADTLARKMPGNIECKTMNALGHRALMNGLGSRIDLQQNKVYKITKEILEEENAEDSLWDKLKDIATLVGIAQSSGIVLREEKNAKGLIEDSEETWRYVCDHFDVDYSPDIVALARRVLKISTEMAIKKGIIDFNDQIYIPALWGISMPKYLIVIIDEAQDLSPLQHKILKKILERNSRLIAVGDPHQAIYGFRGAAQDSMDRLQEEFSANRMGLSCTFRCPQAVTLEASTIVPHIWCPESANPGSVSKLREPWHPNDFPQGSAILCRNVAPIIRVGMAALVAGRPVAILGRDIGKSLEKTVETVSGTTGRGRWKKMNKVPALEFFRKLEEWKNRELEYAREKEDSGKEAQVRDRAASIEAISEGQPDLQDNYSIISIIRELFESATDSLTLCTIHKAKGLEWENVYILDPWRIPSKYAKATWQLEQEENLRYVAVTRSLDSLVYINSDQMRESFSIKEEEQQEET